MMLEVGMTIYEIGLNVSQIRRYKVTRVTPKRAYIEIRPGYEIAFNRDVGSGDFFRQIGYSKWDHDHYSIETPELVIKYKRREMLRKVESIKMESLSIEQLSKIVEIAEAKGE